MDLETLRSAKKTWDEIDSAKVRDVSWLALGPVADALDGWHARSDLRSQRIASVMRSRHDASAAQGLRGAALVCGDLESERKIFAARDGVAFAEVVGYDIVGVHGLHHVFNLGGLFYQIHKALRPGGIFYMEEWIGPAYLQFPKRNAFFARLFLWLLFRRAERTDHLGRVKGKWLQAAPAEFDPSEACNAEELFPQFHRYLYALSIRGYGGLLYPVFEGLGATLDCRRRSVRWRVRLVVVAEKVLQALGLVKPLFVTAVAERRPHVIDRRAEAWPLWKRIANAAIPPLARYRLKSLGRA